VTPGTSLRASAGALAAGMVLVAGMALSAAPLAAQAAGGPPAADTLRTRADSVRARVLERIREQSARPIPPDSVGAVPDTVPPLPGEAVPGAARLPGDTLGRGGQAGQPGVRLPAGADSIMRALVALPGFTAAAFEGRRAEYEAGSGSLTLLGQPPVAPAEGEEPTGGTPARFSGQGVRVEADSSIVFDDASGRVRTVGFTLLIPDRGDEIRSRTLIYDVREGRASAFGAETTYAEGGGEWIVRGDLDSVRDGELFGSRARFTTDDRPEPNSYFEAAELKVLNDRILVARSVSLHFSDVPVLWLPFLAQPLQSGRQSGILAPRFSVNDIVRTSGSYQRRISNVGFYWAMSDYSDATLAADWWSGEYTALTGGLRYRWARRFLGGELSARRFWRESGARDFALSTRNNWDPTERTKVSLSGNYVSNTNLVTQNSLDPRELTSSINSQAGMQQRFGWGSLSVEARRQQYLTDDRLEMTLPSATLNINSFTLFPATPNRARWYNNVTVGGSSRFSRDVREFAREPGQPFQFGQADQLRTQGSAGGSISLGNLSLRMDASYRENAFEAVPEYLARPRVPFPIVQPEDVLDPLDRPRTDYSDAQVDWNTSLSYQQRLIGTSSITPSLSLGGQMIRVDSVAAARDFVEGPTRLAFGLGAQTEVYGFYPGFRGFDAIRHKLTPSISYSYQPAVTPTALQEQVFGSRALGVQSAFSVTVNQTFEARVREAPRGAPGAPGGPGAPGDPDTEDPVDHPGAPENPEDAPVEGDPEGPDPAEAVAPGQSQSLLDDDEGLERPPPSRVVTLLALSTQAVSYDLVRADSSGQWIDGFTTQQLRNSVRSDFLRGLNLSFTHDLFQEPTAAGDVRRFRPHLSQLAMGFQLDGRSAPVRILGRLLGRDMGEGSSLQRADGADPAEEDLNEPTEGFNDDRVLPGMSGSGRSRGPVVRRDGWTARVNYSLRRPRSGENVSQMINGTVNFAPSELLGVSWTTGYDVEARAFTDHMITVQRDMYDWEASFGFRQSVNGNWLFRFEVSLKANRDLRFDHETRNLDGNNPTGFPGGDQGF
jgi:hypothetical protein